MKLNKIVHLASICVGNKIFTGKFENDPIAWYFLAKGIFCSFSLELSYMLIETIKRKL